MPSLTKVHNLCSSEDREYTEDTESVVPISRCLFRYLLHPSERVRYSAAVGLQQLFVHTAAPFDQKRTLLRNLDAGLKSLCDAPPARSAESAEEGSGETSTMMMTLGPLALNCPELEREIVTALVLNYKSLGVPIRQLLSVVRNVASVRYPGNTVGRYVLPMLSFVLNEFLKQELPLEDFPHQLVNCDSAEAFVRRFESLVVPLYLWRAPRAESLAALKGILGVQRSHVLVERNFVRILAYYLPEVTHSKDKLNKVEQKANELSKMMLKRLGENCYYEHIQSKFPQILSEVYKQIYDPESVRKSLGFESAALATRPNPPHTTVAKLDRLHDYFLQSFPDSSPGSQQGRRRPLFAYLTQEILPHCLQDIALKLTDVLRDREVIQCCREISQDRHGNSQLF